MKLKKSSIYMLCGGLAALAIGFIGELLRLRPYKAEFDRILREEAGDMEQVKVPLNNVLKEMGSFPTFWQILIIIGQLLLIAGTAAFVVQWIGNKAKKTNVS